MNSVKLHNFHDVIIVTHNCAHRSLLLQKDKEMGTAQRQAVFSVLLGCFAVSKLEEAHLLHASTVVPLGRRTGRGDMMVMMVGVGKVAYTSLQFCLYG